jgi:hypothetical protein
VTAGARLPAVELIVQQLSGLKRAEFLLDDQLRRAKAPE